MAEAYVPIFLDWVEQTQELNDQERGRLINALVLYARGDEWEKVIRGNERYVFPAFKAQIDRYRRICAERAEAGRAGGKAKSSKSKQTLPNDTKSKQTLPNNTNISINTSITPYNPPMEEENEEPTITVEAYAIANLDRMTSGNLEDFASYRGDLPDELIRWAIDEAAAHGARTWAYVKRILNNLIDRNVTTVGEAKALAERREKKIPTVEDNNPALKAKFY